MKQDGNGRPLPFDDLGHVIGEPFDPAAFEMADFDDIPAPTHWPSVPAVDTAAAWDDLRTWVDGLQERFGHLDAHVIPRCWWRHNDHVEALAALRDHERSSFATTAPATGPVDWFRALRDITFLLKTWTADLACAAAHHDPPIPLRTVDRNEWERYVTSDVGRRERGEIGRAAE